MRKRFPVEKAVRAGTIQQGRFFKKLKGSYTYLRISESAVRFMKLNPDKVWGVCFNGNITDVNPDTLVEKCSLGDFVKNIDEDRQWHVDVGARLE